MRSIKYINADITIIKEAIRYAMADGNAKEVDMLYIDLDELLEELHNAQTATI